MLKQKNTKFTEDRAKRDPSLIPQERPLAGISRPPSSTDAHFDYETKVK